MCLHSLRLELGKIRRQREQMQQEQIRRQEDERQQQVAHAEANLRAAQEAAAALGVPTAAAVITCECTVCCHEYNEIERTRMALLCGHQLCSACLTQLRASANPSCPSCRARIGKAIRLFD